MGKKDINADGKAKQSFLKIRSYAVSEIFAAGGATAFAAKMNKNHQNLAVRLKEYSRDAFLTDDEAKTALQILKSNK